jgi:hypothetical protein
MPTQGNRCSMGERDVDCVRNVLLGLLVRLLPAPPPRQRAQHAVECLSAVRTHHGTCHRQRPSDTRRIPEAGSYRCTRCSWMLHAPALPVANTSKHITGAPLGCAVAATAAALARARCEREASHTQGGGEMGGGKRTPPGGTGGSTPRGAQQARRRRPPGDASADHARSVLLLPTHVRLRLARMRQRSPAHSPALFRVAHQQPASTHCSPHSVALTPRSPSPNHHAAAGAGAECPPVCATPRAPHGSHSRRWPCACT